MFLVINEDKHGVSKKLRDAMIAAGVSEQPLPISIHVIPKEVAESVTVDQGNVNVRFRGMYNTLACQQLVKLTVQKFDIKASLHDDRIEFILHDVEQPVLEQVTPQIPVPKPAVKRGKQ